MIKFHLTADDVRNYCIFHELYTQGNNAEYGAMLDMCGEIDIETIGKIARNIIIHSNQQTMLEEYGSDMFEDVFSQIATDLCNKAYVIYKCE